MVDINKVLKREDRSKVFREIKEKTKPKLNVQQIMQRRSNAKADLDKWRSLLQTAYHYAMPNYNPFENYGQGGAIAPGQEYNGDVYDLTLQIAHQRLADKMLMGMVPQGHQWMKFKPGDEFGEPGTDIYRQAEIATQKITDEFFKILNKSNFYLATSESINDVLVSTGVLAINEGPKKNPLMFEAAPPSQVMFEGNAQGGFDAIFRDWYKVKFSNIKNLWPKADLSKLNYEPDQKLDLYECSYIDPDASEKEKFKYVVMTSKQEVIVDVNNPSWPWVIYRMRKLTGEVRGRGPTMNAWPTASTINKALEDELIAAAFKANPMYMAASDSAWNEETFEPSPGTIIPVQMVMGQWPIQPLQAGGDINFGALIINDFRDQINRMLYTSPLGPVDGPNTTATEANIRYTENLESFAAMIPRLQNEFFTPVIERCLYVINKVVPETFAGIDDSIREKLISLDGQILSLAYETPLMTAQGQVKVDAVIRFFNSLAAVIGPEGAAATLNVPDTVTSMAENSGVDPRLVKSKSELEQGMGAIGNVATQVAENEGIEINE